MSLLAQKTDGPVLVGAHADAGKVFVPDKSRGERPRSYAVADFPLPSGREEEWRFTPVDRLGALLADQPSQHSLVPNLDLPDGVTLTDITAEDARVFGAPAPADRSAAVAAAHAPQVRHLDVPTDLVVDKPVRVRLHGTGETAYGHGLVTVGANAKATVVIEHTGHAAYGDLVSFLVGEGANVTVVTLQDWDDDAVHVAQHDVVVGRDAHVRHIAVTLGGRIVRISTNASYAGPGGTFEGYGVYFADTHQHQEHRLFVDHGPASCRSYVEYKGALQGDTAHTVWVGDVLIRATAEGTSTYELNRNLVLTDGARADSVPNLEIETGEIVGAGHASATGRFDDEQLFYLQARGIPVDAARRLVVRGFFASVVSRIGVPEVIGHVMSAIDEELGHTEVTLRSDEVVA